MWSNLAGIAAFIIFTGVAWHYLSKRLAPLHPKYWEYNTKYHTLQTVLGELLSSGWDEHKLSSVHDYFDYMDTRWPALYQTRKLQYRDNVLTAVHVLDGNIQIGIHIEPSGEVQAEFCISYPNTKIQVEEFEDTIQVSDLVEEVLRRFDALREKNAFRLKTHDQQTRYKKVLDATLGG